MSKGNFIKQLPLMAFLFLAIIGIAISNADAGRSHDLTEYQPPDGARKIFMTKHVSPDGTGFGIEFGIETENDHPDIPGDSVARFSGGEFSYQTWNAQGLTLRGFQEERWENDNVSYYHTIIRSFTTTPADEAEINTRISELQGLTSSTWPDYEANNLVDPIEIMPISVETGVDYRRVLVEFETMDDGSGNLVIDHEKWAIIEIVTNVEDDSGDKFNLLTDPPTSLSGGEFYTSWSSSISNQAFSDVLVDAIRLHRYITFTDSEGESESEEEKIYLAKNIGPFYLQWDGEVDDGCDCQEKDRAGLVGFLSDNFSELADSDNMDQRVVRISSESGTSLENPYIKIRSTSGANGDAVEFRNVLDEDPDSAVAEFALYFDKSLTKMEVEFSADGFQKKSKVIFDPGELPDTVELKLEDGDQDKPVTITANIKLEDDSPVTGAWLELVPYNPYSRSCDWLDDPFGETTDSSGVVTLTVQEGQYCAFASPGDSGDGATSFVPGPWNGASDGGVNVGGGPESFELTQDGQQSVTLIVSQGVTASGTVYDPTGTNGVANVQVVFEPTGGFVDLGSSNSGDGNSGSNGNGNGSDDVIGDDGMSDESDNSSVGDDGMDPNATNNNGDGTNSGSGYDDDDDDDENQQSAGDSAETVTDENGQYSIALKPGVYNVFVRTSFKDNATKEVQHSDLGYIGGYRKNAQGELTSDPGMAETVTIEPSASISDVNFILDQGIPVSGQIQAPNLDGVSKVLVRFEPVWDYINQMELGDPVEVITDDSGNYVASITAGTYLVKVVTSYFDDDLGQEIDAEGGFIGGFRSEDGTVQQDEFVASELVVSEAMQDVDVILDQSTKIKGTITSGGNPLENVFVFIDPITDFDFDDDENPFGDDGSILVGIPEFAQTDANGYFEVNAMPGLYRIAIETDYWHENKRVIVPGGAIGGFADDNGGVVNDMDEAEIFLVEDGQDVTVDTVLDGGVSISGTVMSDSGAVENVNVIVQKVGKDSEWFHASTDENGQFSVFVEPQRRYTIEMWPEPCDQTLSANCDDSNDFPGGLWISPPGNDWVTGSDLESEWDEEDELDHPMVTASEIDAGTDYVSDVSGDYPGNEGAVPGFIVNNWDPHFVTQLVIDGSVEILAIIEESNSLEGRLVDEMDQPIAHAWIDVGVGGTETDSDGYFKLQIPATTVGDAEETYMLEVYPGWDDATGRFDQSFLGGFAVDQEGSFIIEDNFDAAFQFSATFTNWPQDDIDGESGEKVGLLLKASAGKTLQGNVTLDGGSGLEKAWVFAWDPQSGEGREIPTDSSGAFTLAIDVPDTGEDNRLYEIGVHHPDYVVPEALVAEVDDTGVIGIYTLETDENGTITKGDAVMDGGNVATTATFDLVTGRTISGRVFKNSDTGRPVGVPWVGVEFYTLDGSYHYGTGTDEDGFYKLTVASASDFVGVVWGWDGAFRTTFYKDATNEDSAQIVDTSSGDLTGINFRVSSGVKIEGTITGLDSGKKVWVEAYSESTDSWGGVRVIGNAASESGPVEFAINGLASADDFILSFWSDDYISGVYGGDPDPDSDPVGPVDWDFGTHLSTTNGDLSGVNLLLSSGGSLTVELQGLSAQYAGVEIGADVWSDSLGTGSWTESTVGSDGTLSLTMTGVDTSGKDYRLSIFSPTSDLKGGFYKKQGDGEPGKLVGNWDRATKLHISGDISLQISLETGGSISGTVTGLPDGEKAMINVWSESTWSWAEVKIKGDGTGSMSYEMSGLEYADDYRVEIIGLGRSQIRGGFYDSTSSSLTHYEEASFVTISSASPSVSGIDLNVSTGRSISGTVSGMSDSSLKAKWVWIEAWSDSTFSYGGVNVEAKGQDSQTYTIEGLDEADDFEVVLYTPGKPPMELTGKDTTSDNLTGVDFDLSQAQGGTISGTISGLDAKQRLWIDAWSPTTDGYNGIGARADDSGSVSFELEGLETATDYVLAMHTSKSEYFYSDNGPTPLWDSATPISVTAGQTVADKDMDLAQSSISLYSLSGTISGITEESQESAGIEIFAWSESGGFGWTTRNGEGDFTIEGLVGGSNVRYTVEVYADGFVPLKSKEMTVTSGAVDAAASGSSNWTTSWSDAGTIPLTTDTTGMDVTLVSDYSISGTVTGTITDASGLQVTAWSDTLSQGGGDKTDSNGSFVIEGLSPGTYDLTVWSLEGDATTSVEIVSTDLTGQTLTITKPEGSAAGTVTLGDASLAFVELIKDSSVVAEGATDTSGNFTFSPIDVGTYTVKAYKETVDSGSSSFTLIGTSSEFTVSSGSLSATGVTVSGD